MFDLFISSMALAIACFTLTLLPFQPPSQSKSPFALMLACLLFFSVGPLVFKLMPQMIQPYISLIPVVFFIFVPGLRFYHEALISSHKWQWRKVMLKHFAPVPFMILLALFIFLLPEQEFEGMFFSDKPAKTDRVKFLSVWFLIAVVVWCMLSCLYVFAIIKRTLNYRRHLKDVYSDEQGKSLQWLNMTAIVITFSWIYALVVLTVENRLEQYGVSETGVLVLLTVIVWFISANGLRQRPGFEDAQITTNQLPEESSKKTYERSAVSQHDLARISEKLSVSINRDKIHLEPELNLSRLSKQIGEPSQYISQTLSQELNTTFFDLINQARIEDAKQMLSKTNNSVLDIALSTGFNARSSFYKAFKQFTDLTPSQYRNSQRKS